MIEDMELYLEKVFKKENPEKYIEILEQDREDFAKEIIELQQRIDKAIEKLKKEYYINEHEWNDRIINEVIEILGDKENE